MFRHLSAIWTARHFLLALVKLDLRLRYRRSVLGIGWSLLHPLAMTAVFTVVFSQLFGGGDPVGYAAYALAGLAVWAFLREAATLGSKAFLLNESYIRQSPMPYTIYTLRTVLGQVTHACLALTVVVALVAVWKQDAGVLVGVLLAVPGLLLALVAAWAVATIGAFPHRVLPRRGAPARGGRADRVLPHAHHVPAQRAGRPRAGLARGHQPGEHVPDADPRPRC